MQCLLTGAVAGRRREAKVDLAAAREEELGPVPPEVLQFESQVVPGLGEHGKGAPIGDHNEVGISSLKG